MSDMTVDLAPQPEEHRIRADGAVSSVQEAELEVPPGVLATLREPEVLGASYWRHVRSAAFGLIRILDEAAAPSIALASRWILLFRFGPPTYEQRGGRVAVTWPIEGGLLVAPEGRGSGWLRIELSERTPTGPGPAAATGGSAAHGRPGHRGRIRVHVRVEVRDFHPWLRRGGRLQRLGAWLYAQTQLRVHRRLGNGFLRSLARADPASGVAAP